MYFDATGQRVFNDEVDLLVEEIAKERHYEHLFNEDASGFWQQYDGTVISYGVADFYKGYTELRDAIGGSKVLSNYAVCLGIRLRCKSFMMTAVSTLVTEYSKLRTGEGFLTALDNPLDTMDAFAELMFFTRVNNDVILRRILEMRTVEQLKPPEVPKPGKDGR